MFSSVEDGIKKLLEKVLSEIKPQLMKSLLIVPITTQHCCHYFIKIIGYLKLSNPASAKE